MRTLTLVVEIPDNCPDAYLIWEWHKGKKTPFPEGVKLTTLQDGDLLKYVEDLENIVGEIGETTNRSKQVEIARKAWDFVFDFRDNRK